MTVARLCHRGAAVCAVLYAASASGQTAEPSQQHSDEELARQLSNPVASLISAPLQENMDFGIGPDDGFRSTLNIQPVVPVTLSGDWNLIVRTILPVIHQEDVTGPFESEGGLGDVLQSFFLSPAQPTSGGIIWGVGPAFLYPTATDKLLGKEKWGAGPTALVLKQAGGATFGFLANHIWSVAGDDDRDGVSSTFLQPFYSHTTAAATTYGINAEASYDWKAEEWLAPINLTVTQLAKIGRQPVSIGGGVRYYADKPEGGPDWGTRLIFTMLFPKGR